MSGIVLSASVRQNLLSLQSTADLLATTQNRLATGKKVNTALDNPTNYFTAASLDNRASDINNLLDGIGNGVQVLQAANTGITSLQKLVDTAKSIASQTITKTGTAPTGEGVDIGAATATVGTVNAAVADPTSQASRSNLVAQYNVIIQQITTTSQDSSFNGVNLLNGDNLKLTFNETGKSSLNINGVTFNAGGLGLGALTAGTDFLDSYSANAVITKLG